MFKNAPVEKRFLPELFGSRECASSIFRGVRQFLAIVVQFVKKCPLSLLVASSSPYPPNPLINFILFRGLRSFRSFLGERERRERARERAGRGTTLLLNERERERERRRERQREDRARERERASKTERERESERESESAKARPRARPTFIATDTSAMYAPPPKLCL
jgi:hypothetical protein